MGSNAFKIILFSGIFLLPFIVWPYSPTPFEVPRVWFLQRWIELLAITVVIFELTNLVWKAKNKPNLLLLVLPLLYLVASFYSSWQGVDWNKSLTGNYFRSDGLVTLLHFVGLVFVLSLYWQEVWKKTLSILLTISSALLGFWALDESVNLHLLRNLSGPQFGDAVGASFGQPNFLAGYLLVTLPFCLYLYSQVHDSKKKALVRIALIFIVLGIFLTMSWGGILGLFVLALLYFVLSRYRPVYKITLGALMLLGLAGALFYYSQTRPVFVVGHTTEALHPESRERIIGNAIAAIKQKPIWGWGYSNFDHAFKSNPADRDYPFDVYVDKAHSIVLENLVTTGVVGTAIYLLFVFALLGILVKRLLTKKDVLWSKTLFAALVIYLIHSQTNVISVNEEFIFWLIAGILASRTT